MRGARRDSLRRMDDHVSHLPDVRPPEGGKARRVYLLLKDRIARGDYREGTALPGEQRLAQEFDVSRVTIRRALDALLGDALIEKRPGSATLVRPGAGRPLLTGDFTTLMPQLLEMSEASEARLLAFSYGTPSAAVAAALGLDPSDRVQIAVRTRLVGGEPFSHLTTFVPEAIARTFSEADLATTPLFRLLERSGVKIDSASQTVSATLASPEVAEALGTPVGAALLQIERVVRDAEGRGVEVLQALYRPDRFRLNMELDRTGATGNRQWTPVVGGKDRTA